MDKLFFYAKLASDETVALERDGNCYTLPRTVLEQTDRVTVCCDWFNANVGDEGFYLFSGSRTMEGGVLTTFREREDCDLTVAEPVISWFAVKIGGTARLFAVERHHKYRIHAICKGRQYRIFLTYDLTEQPVCDDLRLAAYELPDNADHNTVTRTIREIQLQNGVVRTLKERCAEREELDYARRYPLIRIRMGWKPVPPPILHQTLENEPPMHVACTFARVRDIADELKRQGVEGAELSLVGWNVRGHDGRWPQIFPADEALGGEEELKKTVAYVQALGYRITCHTNSLDWYEIAENFDWSKIAQKRDGSYVANGTWAGGQAYRACPHCQLEQAKKDLPRVAALGFRGLHYIDVLSIIEPDVCFSPDHVCGLKDGIARMEDIMEEATKLFGGFQSEGCLDFSVSGLDYSLYNSFRTRRGAPEGIVDRYLPLFEMIYHGIVLYNPSATTVNCGVKSADEAVTVAVLGGRPTYYINSKFRVGLENWMGEDDALCGTDAELRATVAMIRKGLDDYQFRNDSYLLMESYDEREDGLRIVTYDNGLRICGNTTDSDLVYDGVTVTAHSWKLFGKE